MAVLMGGCCDLTVITILFSMNAFVGCMPDRGGVWETREPAHRMAGDWTAGEDGGRNRVLRYVMMATEGVQRSARCLQRAPDENALLGITIAAGQLEYTLINLTANTADSEAIRGIQGAIAQLESIQTRMIEDEESAEIQKDLEGVRILHEHFWRFAAPKRRLGGGEYCSSFKDTVQTAEPLTEKETDRCLLQITQQEIGECTLWDGCRHMMVEDMDCVGYTGTHQMFFMLLSWRMGCGDHFSPSLDYVLTNCSQRMYSQYCAIMNSAPTLQTRDIFMEYALFGGLSGFEEFLKDDVFLHILEWQHEDGCFYFTDDVTRVEDSKNSIHETAVATALLGVYAQYYSLLSI